MQRGFQGDRQGRPGGGLPMQPPIIQNNVSINPNGTVYTCYLAQKGGSVLYFIEKFFLSNPRL